MPDPHATATPTHLLLADRDASRAAVLAVLSPPHALLEAASCADALRLAGESAPDLALVGVELEAGNGYDLCRQLRSAHPPLPVLLLGVPADAASRPRAAEAGASELVTAPIDPAELRLRVAALLRTVTCERRKAEQEDRAARLENLRDAIDIVVHDLRSPLGGAVLNLSVVDPATLVEDDRDALASATLSLQRVTSVVDDFLDVRRLEAGAAPPQARESLADLVGDATRSIAQAAGERRVTIRFAAPARVGVEVDRALVTRAIANLVENGIRYSPAGGAVEVTIATEGGRAVVEIADRGPAVPGAEKRALFDAYALPRSVRRGTGVGLHLAWCVARAFGGDLAARDRPGGGAIFRLDLPLAPPVGV